MSTPAHRAVAGASYFVTTKCWQGRSLFQVTEVAEILRGTLFNYRDSGAYLLHEFVIMPDHLHLMLTPNSQTSLEKAVQLIKGGSSHRIHKERDNKMEIWQEGFHDWTMRNLEDWKTKADYIHMNPVKARLCERPEDWPYSSANRNYCLDCVPERYQNLASGAKAQIASPSTPGLKPRPPKESEEGAERSSFAIQTPNVGPKGPTPRSGAQELLASGAKAQIPGTLTPGLKPRPPKESEKIVYTPGHSVKSTNVGPEGPTPVAISKRSGG